MALDAASGRERLRTIMRPIEAGAVEGVWDKPVVQSRDRAMLLLGFSRPVQTSSSELAALGVTDVTRTAQGLEVRLFKRSARPTHYVTVPMSEDPMICPVNAMTPW